MKSLICFVLLGCLIAGCASRHETYYANVDSKAKKKQIVYPPQSFIDAVFNYKKKNYRWPDVIDNICVSKECLQEYKLFMDRGIESLVISKSTRDTLLLDFTYSRRKNAAHYGTEGDKGLIRDITGKYEFVHDSSFVFFRVVLTKPKFFSVSFK